MSTPERPRSLADLDSGDTPVCGLKAANLGSLIRGGFPVPPGFALTIDAYGTFLDASGAADAVRGHLESFSADPDVAGDLGAFDDLAERLTAAVEGRSMPPDLAAAVGAAYDDLCGGTGEDLPVAVRSSGPASHPGQFRTDLDIRGTAAVLDAVVRVWASTFCAGALVARARGGLPLERDPIGAAVQRMVHARASGVMFTLDPHTGDRSRVVIEAVPGTGERLVGGEVTPDRWAVDRVIGEITERTPASPGAFCLSDEEVVALAKLGVQVERHFGSPQDIEWALGPGARVEDALVVLQSRPEQTWSRSAPESKLDLAGRSWGDLACEHFTRREE